MASSPGFLIAGVMKASLNVAGKWPAMNYEAGQRFPLRNDLCYSILIVSMLRSVRQLYVSLVFNHSSSDSHCVVCSLLAP